MDTHTYAYVKLLLSPRHSRGITHFIYPKHSFAQWSGWIREPVVSVATFVFFAALLSHLWVGLRDVLFDYARPAGFRRFLLAVVALALAGIALWVLRILFWR
jgi:succinate dehydrogenase / fumarate reductase membrane anchor subunit